ncbi:MAG: helix-turn-helix transcriptional regulator [Treponema sp.]|nr:helix-turn-helix transcriptional regulator [Treponema sp.]MEE3436185.1 helix-turn-helix transcriptional regulator [Treponema sp.]
MSISECQMYKNKNGDRNNISGIQIAQIRKKQVPRMSQRALADKMQLAGIDLDKNAIQRIESGQRFVTDIELRVFSKVLGASYIDLLDL